MFSDRLLNQKVNFFSTQFGIAAMKTMDGFWMEQGKHKENSGQLNVKYNSKWNDIIKKYLREFSVNIVEHFGNPTNPFYNEVFLEITKHFELHKEVFLHGIISGLLYGRYHHLPLQ